MRAPWLPFHTQLLVFLLPVFLAACGASVSSGAITAESVDRVTPATQPSITVPSSIHLSTPRTIRQTGFGASVVNLELNRLPAVLTLGTLGGSHMVLAHHAGNGLTLLDLLKTQSLVEGAAGISAIDKANGFARVNIQTSDEWGFELLELTDFQFVSAPWSAIGSGNQFLFLDDDFDGSLHLVWPGDGGVISVQSLDGGPDSDLLVSTTMPYDDWLSVPKGARALYILAAGDWTLELGERR